MATFPSRSFVLTVIAAAAIASGGRAAVDQGLLFYLSGDHGTTADFSATHLPGPTYDNQVTQIADGARGGALQCGDLQQLAYRAPGNIQAQRGTLSFFWRSRYAVGPTAFPVFRVGYADHSSWDMVWLRIDYNGHGFDAFVTDASLARTRVSITLQPFPSPQTWTHLAFAWDEARGVRLYVNGRLAGQVDTTARYDAALDQFGPHSRIISPYQVQSDYNFVRGGDIDEVRIYDRMLDDRGIVALAQGETPDALTTLPARSLTDASTRSEWAFRYGWNRAEAPPPYYAGKVLTVRKVEIHDAFDLGRWWWKANDGIRETTWPGVYNRSRLPGRDDYFQLPDWDCYVESGRSITFTMPEEPWNHLEISGSAWGKMELLKTGTKNDAAADALLFERPRNSERTVHPITNAITGQKIRFTNVEPEEPIGELAAYNVTSAAEPDDRTHLTFQFSSLSAARAGAPASLEPLYRFIDGRFPADERASLVAVSAGEYKPAAASATSGTGLPLVHLLIPNSWDNLEEGLDGIALELPALKVKPTHGGLFPLNLQVHDPLWPLRTMLDFTWSVKPGEAKTLWLDLRDRLLPKGRGLWLSMAGAGQDFDAASLDGARIRLVFKSRAAARPEHESDRFTQARDSYAMLVEEHPTSPKLDLWNRFKGDLDDLLRANPDHVLGRQYAAVATGAPRPPYAPAKPPTGVPEWAFRQVELLSRIRAFVLWYIDHRQSAYGDFGGGISDDVDLLNTWPGVALMGVEPEKLTQSLRALLDAAYKNGMFTNGLPTIQADELHSYEEGINCLAQNLILDFGSPQQLERAMVTARGLATVTGINTAGHRHMRSSYYSGTKLAAEDPWGWAKPYSYLVLQVPQLLVAYNGTPAPKKYLLELADGLLAHCRVGADGRVTPPSAIHFATDRDGPGGRTYFPWNVYWSAWEFTGEKRYLAPILDGGPGTALTVGANTLDLLNLRAAANKGEATRGRGPGNPHLQWQLTGDKANLTRLYAEQTESCALLEYINTEGSLWIDRVNVPYTDIQRARLGGVALARNSLLPGHAVSWSFRAPANERSVGLLIPNATRTSFKVIAYNLETTAVRATMTGWNIDPGAWEITQGVDTNDDDIADGTVTTRTEKFERSGSLDFTFPPRATTVLTLQLKTAGTPYWQRPDLGLDRGDVTLAGDTIRVTVHSLGSVPSPASTIALRDSTGRIVTTTSIPSLAAPNDLLPKTAEVLLTLPGGTSTSGATIEIDPEHHLEEITARNNAVSL